MERNETFVVNAHEKGNKRGMSIYFGREEVKALEKIGIDMRKERKFVVELKPRRICLIPLSELSRKGADIGVLFEITSRLDAIVALDKEDKEELCEELLSIIVEKGVKISEMERTAIMRMIKGVYSRDVLKNVLSACVKADEVATLSVIDRFVISNSSEKKGGEKNGI